ncbi:hypothetical protein ACJZ2D_004783 [Fusarium nematophilum]
MASEGVTETAPAPAALNAPLPPAPTPAWQILHDLAQAQAQAEQAQADDDDSGMDDADSDLDSALGSNAADSTMSLSSSVFDYRTLHGRTYHSDRGNAHYWASNDEQASDSLDIAHHFALVLLEDKLHLAPLGPNIQRALDIGTGTAIWAIDFAEEHPGAEVIGTEISPTQPAWIPSNLKLQVSHSPLKNVRANLDANSVDFIHMRFLLGSITDWTHVFKEAFTTCKPGGWVESYEVMSVMQSDDDTIPPGSAMETWGQIFLEGGRRAGQTFAIIQEDVQRRGMESAGFINIHVIDLKAPIGGWSSDPRLKQVGQFMQAALERDYEGYLLFLACELLGWTKEQVSTFCGHLRREVRSGRHHPYFRQRVVYGQKPDLF